MVVKRSLIVCTSVMHLLSSVTCIKNSWICLERSEEIVHLSKISNLAFLHRLRNTMRILLKFKFLKVWQHSCFWLIRTLMALNVFLYLLPLLHPWWRQKDLQRQQLLLFHSLFLPRQYHLFFDNLINPELHHLMLTNFQALKIRSLQIFHEMCLRKIRKCLLLHN